MYRTAAQLEPLGGGLQQGAASPVEQGIAPQLWSAERSVERTLRSSFTLLAARPYDALADGGARFADRVDPEQFDGGLPGNRHLEVDAIANRTREPGAIGLALERRALAEPLRISSETAGA